MLTTDAKSLANGEREHIGVIDLVADWEESLPKLLYRYQKDIRVTYNSFKDPHDKDEAEWTKAHYRTTMEFLIKHGIAIRTDEDNI